MAFPEGLQTILDEAFKGERKYGPKAGPGRQGVKRLMVRGLAVGLTKWEVEQFAQPGFYRGINDPYGGSRLLDDVTSKEDLKALSDYAKTCSGSGIVEGGSTKAQSDFFDAFDGTSTDYRAKYIAQAAE